MNRIRFRIRIDKGRRGVALEKLENIVAETTKFLLLISEDLKLSTETKWVGTEFRNQSLSFNVEYPLPVPHETQVKFNSGVIGLMSRKREPFVRPATALGFYSIAKPLGPDDKMRIAIFPNGNNKTKWFTVSHDFSNVEQPRAVTKSEYIGAAQGTIHSWFKEADTPHFHLRESLSGALVKCYYNDELYAKVTAAVKMRDQIIHVHGIVTADMLTKTIEEIRADNILVPERFTFRDYMEFVHPSTEQ